MTLQGTEGQPGTGTRDGDPGVSNEGQRNAADDAARNGQSDGEDDLDTIDDPKRLRDLLREMRKGERKRNEGYNSLKADHDRLMQERQQAERAANASAPLEERVKTLEKDIADRDQKIARLEQERKDDKTNRELVTTARRLNAIDPDDVIRLIDKDDLTIEEDGTPTNAEPVIKQFLKRKPQYARTSAGGADGGERGRPGSGSSDMNDILRSARRGRVTSE